MIIKESMKNFKMQSRNVFIFMFAILVSSCLKQTAVPIKSAFSIELSEDKASPVTIQLKNESYGADEYEWTYEGGIPSSSNQKSPGKVVFTQAGATTLEVIHNAQKYIPSKYYNMLKGLQLEDVIAHADDAGDFRFDIQWSALDPKTKKSISVFVDTKNYSTANNMFKNLGQFKAYIRDIDNFDQLYIIQQGGRGVTREQIIAQLERSIAKDAEGVYYANKQLWQKFRLRTPNELQKACKTKALSESPTFENFRNIILITK